MKKVIGVLLCLPLIFWVGLRVYNSFAYNIDCSGHIKRAANANTVELAKQEMKTVTVYLESRGMTSGYTSLLYRQPDEDVGFWYQNLKASLGELEKITPETSQLERSNLLIKLRETLLDHGESSEHVVEPSGISAFPNNGAFALFGWLSAVVAIIGLGFFVAGLDD